MPRASTLSIILTALWRFIILAIIAMFIAAAMGHCPAWIPLTLAAMAVIVVVFVHPRRQ